MFEHWFLSLAAASLPVFFFWVLHAYLERPLHEPFFRLLLVFGAALIFAFLPSIFLNSSIEEFLQRTITAGGAEILSKGMLGPLLEESLKALVVAAFIFWSRDCDNLTDGLIYGATAGLGFAFAENAHYFHAILKSQGPLAFIDNVYSRGLFSTTLHVMASAIVGAMLGLTRFYHRIDRYLYRFVGWVLAVMLHVFWNVMLILAPMIQESVLAYLPVMASFFIFLFIAVILQLSVLRERNVLREELYQALREGKISNFFAEPIQVLLSSDEKDKRVGIDPLLRHDLVHFGFRLWQLKIAGPEEKKILQQDVVYLQNCIQARSPKT